MKKARNKKRIPLRLCLISREKLPRQALVRIVAKDGFALVDSSGKAAGRGAWVSANPELIQKIQKSRAIERALNCNCDLAFFEALEKAMQDRKVYLDKFYDLKREAELELEQEKAQQEAEKKQTFSQRDKDAFIVSISQSLQKQEKEPKKTVIRKVSADKAQAFLEAERKKQNTKLK